jgi:HD-like signal output (HDOD) protein/CheY-like chemotaxis protein
MVRILFVDDDPNLLAGIRRALRSKRDEWQMGFATDAAQAIDDCANRPPDVVVTDLKMRGMGGEGLLEHLSTHHPDAVRLVLSGAADPHATLRTVTLAHQFMAKPCEASELVERLDRLVGLRRLLDDEGLRADLGRSDELPQAPGVYLELQRVVRSDDVSTEAVARVVEKDPAMGAMVLKVVNSAFVGLPRRVDTVERAVVYLGVTMVEDIVLAADAARAVGSGMTQALEDFQSHAAATALVAQRIAPRHLCGAARTAGFLHDLGALFLASRRGDALAELRREADRVGDGLHERIVESWGLAPAELGAYLLGMWGLPLDLVNAVAQSANPRFKDFGLPEVLHVADALVHELVPNPSSFSSSPELDVPGLRRLGVDRQLRDWRRIAADVVT